MERVASGVGAESIAFDADITDQRGAHVSELRITLGGSERVVAAGTTAGEALEADGRTVVAARVNGQARDLAYALRRRRRRRADRDRLRRGPRHHAPLGRARHGAGRPGAVPRGQAGHRPAGRERLLLRLRRRAPLPARRPQAHREAHARDRQAGAAVLPPGRRRRRRARGAGRRAVQAGADRPQGRAAGATRRASRSAAAS